MIRDISPKNKVWMEKFSYNSLITAALFEVRILITAPDIDPNKFEIIQLNSPHMMKNLTRWLTTAEGTKVPTEIRPRHNWKRHSESHVYKQQKDNNPHHVDKSASWARRMRANARAVGVSVMERSFKFAARRFEFAGFFDSPVEVCFGFGQAVMKVKYLDILKVNAHLLFTLKQH